MAQEERRTPERPSGVPPLHEYEGVIVDLDGCVWIGPQPIAGAAEALERLRAAGKRVVFATNDPRGSVESYVHRLWRAGVRVSADDVVTVGLALERYLSDRLAAGERWRTALVVGAEQLARHAAAAGLVPISPLAPDVDERRIDVVVVGGGSEVTFEHLRRATVALHSGAAMIGTGRDPTYPHPSGPMPGSGAFVALLEYASGRRATIVGKPEPLIFEMARERLGPVASVLAIGDRLDADVLGAHRAGLPAALVLSGSTSERELAQWRHEAQPVAVAASLAELVDSAIGAGSDGT